MLSACKSLWFCTWEALGRTSLWWWSPHKVKAYPRPVRIVVREAYERSDTLLGAPLCTYSATVLKDGQKKMMEIEKERHLLQTSYVLPYLLCALFVFFVLCFHDFELFGYHFCRYLDITDIY